MGNLSQQKRLRMLEFLNKIKEDYKDDDKILASLGEIMRLIPRSMDLSGKSMRNKLMR